jgi:hypothetical protein
VAIILPSVFTAANQVLRSHLTQVLTLEHMLRKTMAKVFKRLFAHNNRAHKQYVDQDLTFSYRSDSKVSCSRVMKSDLTVPTAKLRQHMELLSLPLEVLQLCLTHVTTPSFLQLIVTCHMLWDLAASTRAVILHHLGQMPGIKLGLDDLATTTAELFLTLRRRACLNLFGVHLRADRIDYTFVHSSFNASASCLSVGKTLGLALVADDAVRLYILTPDGLVDRGETLTDPNLCVSQTAIDESGNVAVLYTQSANGRVAEGWDRHGRFLMVYHKWVGSQYKPVSYPYLKGCTGYKATHMAISDQDMMAMVLSRGDLSRHAYSSRAHMAVVCHHLKQPARKSGLTRKLSSVQELTLGHAGTHNSRDAERLSSESDFEAFSQHAQLYPPVPKKDIDQPLSSTIQFLLPLELKPPPLRVMFCNSGQKLRCYAADYPVPSFRLNTAGDAVSDDSAIGKVHIGSCEFLVDNPFYGRHESFDDDHTGTRCTSSYLVLGITTSSRTLHESRPALCIIRARKTVDHDVCRHLINLDSCLTRSFETHVVSRLWGYRPPMTSLPGIVAYSRNATRMAVADWDKILIWALNGQVLVDGDTGSRYYDTVWDDNFEHDHVVLKPILLKAGSVVRQMAFGANENELVALISTGFQVWNLGASGTGKRELHHLDERN